MKEEDNEFFQKILNSLELQERKGLEGKNMLFPSLQKERKLDTEALAVMIRRLYKVPDNSTQYQNVSCAFLHNISSTNNRLKALKSSRTIQGSLAKGSIPG